MRIRVCNDGLPESDPEMPTLVDRLMTAAREHVVPAGTALPRA